MIITTIPNSTLPAVSCRVVPGHILERAAVAAESVLVLKYLNLQDGCHEVCPPRPAPFYTPPLSSLSVHLGTPEPAGRMPRGSLGL